MDNVRILRYDWYTGLPGQGSAGEYLARQYDHLSDMVVLSHAPKLNNYYLIITMKETEVGDLKTLEPIQLSGSYWLIPNIYTQLAQEISFQFCCKTENGDFESHSAEIHGRILPSKDHNGEAIDVDPSIMYDPYKRWVEEIAMAAGAIIIDSELNSSSTNPVQNRVVKAAIDGLVDDVDAVNGRLDEELGQIRSATNNLCTVSTGRYYIDASGNIGDSPTENYVGMSEAIPVTEGESYILSFFDLGVSTTSKMYWAFYASDDTLVGKRETVNRAGTTVYYTVTVPTGASKLCACMYNANGINVDTGIMVSQGASNPTEYIPPYTGLDKAARAAVNALDGEMVLKRKGLISQATVTAEGWTNLIDLPDEYAYGIGAGITIDGKPPKLASASFTLMKFKVRNTVDYGVYLAVGRSVAYYALVYTSDTTPKWIEIGNPDKGEDDHTLRLRWGTTAEIVLLGDSIVQGVGSSDYSATGDTIVTIDGTEFKRNVGVKSWGAQFKEKIESDYYGLTVVNNGLPGKGIHVITANLDSLVTASTKYAIVCAGVNNRNSGATTIQDYYIALFEALQVKGINILCLSPIDKNGATGNTSLAMINTACERACNTCGVPYYNLYGEYNAVLNANTKADYYNDQLHPNDKGYATMFGIICKLLNL